MWVYLLAFSVFLASGCGGTRAYCKRSPLPPSTPNPPDLAAGEYRIALFADCGLREGKSAAGRLLLMQTRARNGPSAASETSRNVVRTPPLYGWTDLEFREVGASICRDRFHPPPESRRPMWPGVLALDTEELLKIDPAAEVSAQTLTMGARPDGIPTTDGCGIALLFEAWDGECYHGVWGPAGIRGDGTGTFRACPTRPGATTRAP
jgi:hypothetical protein